MSAFTPPEIDYLTSQGLARLATVGPDGQPHVAPVTFAFNTEADAIDVGGVDFEAGGSTINPRFPNFAEEFLRIHPTRIVSWGLEEGDGTTPADFRVSSRAVG
jgi:hypothetical protein